MRKNIPISRERGGTSLLGCPDPDDGTEHREASMAYSRGVVLVLVAALLGCGGGEQAGGEADVSSQGGAADTPQAVVGKTACDLVTQGEMAETTGIPVVKVTGRENPAYSSCSYEAEDWMKTSGIIYYPSLPPVSGSTALAEALRQDLERDQAPYTTPTAGQGLGDASASYSATDQTSHFLVVQKGGQRVVVSGPVREALSAVAQLALARM